MILRRALPHDMRTVYRLRNMPESIQFSKTGQGVSYIEHEAWMRKALKNPDILLFIVRSGIDTAGSVRVERQDQEAVLSIYLFPEVRGKGMGIIAISAASREAFKTWDINQVSAEVRIDNSASLGAFAGAGFECAGVSESGFLRLELGRREAYSYSTQQSRDE